MPSDDHSLEVKTIRPSSPTKRQVAASQTVQPPAALLPGDGVAAAASGLKTAVQFFKVLADESRLRLVGILASQPSSVDELASQLGLKPPTVSHHLSRLGALGIVRMAPVGTTHVYRLDTAALRSMSKDVLSPKRLFRLTAAVEPGSWERKVLRDFLDGERLKEIPASRKKRTVILKWLAEQFEPDVRYSEREVNKVIKRHHPDSATLRRELIGGKLMARHAGEYWRLAESE